MQYLKKRSNFRLHTDCISIQKNDKYLRRKPHVWKHFIRISSTRNITLLLQVVIER